MLLETTLTHRKKYATDNHTIILIFMYHIQSILQFRAVIHIIYVRNFKYLSILAFFSFLVQFINARLRDMNFFYK